jgi:hypothetical protein
MLRPPLHVIGALTRFWLQQVSFDPIPGLWAMANCSLICWLATIFQLAKHQKETSHTSYSTGLLPLLFAKVLPKWFSGEEFLEFSNQKTRIPQIITSNL